MIAMNLKNPGMRPDVLLQGNEMGRVTVEARFENLGDIWEAGQGKLAEGDVRCVTITDALVDTGCTLVGLRKSDIEKLGLTPLYKRSVRVATGPGEMTVYSAVRLTINGRFCPTDVMEVPDNIPVLIGQVPLEQLDFVVDLKAQKLIGNPAHGGEHVLEAYGIS